MELTIRNGAVELILTGLFLLMISFAIIIGTILNYEKPPGFAAGDAGGSIMISLSGAAGSEASALGEQNPTPDQVTSQTESQSAPEAPVEEETSEPVEDITPQPEPEAVEPELAEELPIPEETEVVVKEQIIEPEVLPEPVEEVIEEPELAEPEPAEDIIPVTETQVVTAPLPKVRPKPPVQPEPKPEPRQTVQQPQPKAVATPVQPVQEASTGKDAQSSKAALNKESNSQASGEQGQGRSQSNGSVTQTTNNGRGAGQQASGDYWKAVQVRMAHNKDYPRKAKRRKMEGAATIELTLLSSGEVESYRIVKSTGHSVLDRAIEKMIRKSAPFPPFPDDITQSRMTRRVPVIFNMKTS